MKYRLVGLLSAGHLVTDINQGALAALLPFLISEHHLSYAAAASIVFAANIASSVVQPLFGHTADRFSKPLLLPVGLILGGLGLALTGIVPSYRLIILVAMMSGIGIAAYHPQAARLVNLAGGDKKATAMSFFGVGGTLGFAIGPVFITMTVLHWGLKSTLMLIVPVSVVAVIITTQFSRFSMLENSGNSREIASNIRPLKDAWAPFGRLTITVICRSILFYGLIIFIPLYWINVLNQSKAAGGIALTTMASAGVVGNLIGGRLADRFGHVKIIIANSCLLIPLLPAFIWAYNPHINLLLLAAIGLSLSGAYSPTVVIGQKYLPNHIGLASGVTLGVSIAIGGVAAPFLGKIADVYSIKSALVVIALLPALMTGLALTLPDPEELVNSLSDEQLT